MKYSRWQTLTGVVSAAELSGPFVFLLISTCVLWWKRVGWLRFVFHQHVPHGASTHPSTVSQWLLLVNVRRSHHTRLHLQTQTGGDPQRNMAWCWAQEASVIGPPRSKPRWASFVDRAGEPAEQCAEQWVDMWWLARRWKNIHTCDTCMTTRSQPTAEMKRSKSFCPWEPEWQNNLKLMDIGFRPCPNSTSSQHLCQRLTWRTSYCELHVWTDRCGEPPDPPDFWICNRD